MYGMDELWKHYAKRKKPDIKDYILYDSICLKYSEEVDPESRLVVIREGGVVSDCWCVRGCYFVG